MAPGLPDRVDCAHLADDAVVLERVYPLGEMPRLQDLLADGKGSVRASFAFAKIDSGREVYAMDEGLVSLRELAEEELLLALPIVAVCGSPQTCGRAPVYEARNAIQDVSGDRSRPFAALQDLLKKT